MRAGRMTMLGLAGALALGVAGSDSLAAGKAKPFLPPNYPLNIAPVDWPKNPGTRYEMPELVKRYKRDDIVLKVAVAGWTERMWKADDMGTYKVGGRPEFRIVIGDRNSRYFGSVKDGRDGGTLQCTLYWMDQAGKRILRKDNAAVRYACATCGGYYGMYFNVPSFARTEASWLCTATR